MGIALSRNGAAGGRTTSGRPPTCGRGVYVRADASGVAGDRGAVRRHGQARPRRSEQVRPAAGLVRYDAVPRHGAPGSRTSVATGPSHDRSGSRIAQFFGFSGASALSLSALSTVVATVVVTVGVVVGLEALANLSGAPGGVPAQTAVVQVRSGETLSDVAARVAPGAPVGAVVDRIRQLNEMSGSGVRAGQTVLAPVAVTD
ncbi:LysM peptidoglycan-binding domain-containing protein [Rhodococcus sp. SGAir0479]|uniref:LysM peptidoglycan-binding domain-containing protein n=1 Tax=Rhodococcus sp. SGAir0479 TaxID=2567884 RepID=UPI0010CCDBAB|nr:LysM peptidoglycan-binding domain-containing protein [Rhodococcus sp. SGAir0479]QCQ90791.1 LysM peptidoglycan-binding domain-containing protein [Rhodococcus sp. SGAir0479]